jgi:hypothetical protein
MPMDAPREQLCTLRSQLLKQEVLQAGKAGGVPSLAVGLEIAQPICVPKQWE